MKSHVLKRKFEFVKVRYRGLMKNANWVFTALVLVNLARSLRRSANFGVSIANEVAAGRLRGALGSLWLGRNSNLAKDPPTAHPPARRWVTSPRSASSVEKLRNLFTPMSIDFTINAVDAALEMKIDATSTIGFTGRVFLACPYPRSELKNDAYSRESAAPLTVR